jgi:hypothetical protein
VIGAVVEQSRATADGSRFLFCRPLTSVQEEPVRVALKLAGAAGAARLTARSPHYARA